MVSTPRYAARSDLDELRDGAVFTGRHEENGGITDQPDVALRREQPPVSAARGCVGRPAQLGTGVARTTLTSLNIRALSTQGPPHVARKSCSGPCWSYRRSLATSCG